MAISLLPSLSAVFSATNAQSFLTATRTALESGVTWPTTIGCIGSVTFTTVSSLLATTKA